MPNEDKSLVDAPTFVSVVLWHWINKFTYEPSMSHSAHAGQALQYRGEVMDPWLTKLNWKRCHIRFRSSCPVGKHSKRILIVKYTYVYQNITTKSFIHKFTLLSRENMWRTSEKKTNSMSNRPRNIENKRFHVSFLSYGKSEMLSF